MTQEDYITKHNELHDNLRKIAIEKESKFSAINNALNERIKAAKEWAERERRKVSDEAYKATQQARSELTRLHFEFHGTDKLEELQ